MVVLALVAALGLADTAVASQVERTLAPAGAEAQVTATPFALSGVSGLSLIHI